MRFPIPANTISRFLLICLSVLFSVSTNAQGENNPPAGRGGEGFGGRSGCRGGFRVTGNGKVIGSSGNPISAATVTILYPKSIEQIEKINANNFSWADTINFKRKKSTITNEQGQYQINVNLRAFAPEGSDFSWMIGELQNPNSKAFYFLLVAQQNDGKITSQWLNLMSLVNLKQMPPPEGGFEFNIPDMILLNKEESLTAVEIKTQAVLIKGDTTEINANNFKVNPDATAEDLVGKMPGVSSSNGQIQAQGETLKKVLVDGKPFFGEDPNAALKNLPAEVVGKIQIYDAKSEQSLFSGIDDGNTTKTMNIITKSQFRNGLFGRGFAGIGQSIEGTGDQTKYKGGITINSFHGNRRLTFLSQINNINEQNFSFEDLMGSMGGGRMGSRRGNFFTGNQSGITTTRAIGFNYSNQWGKNVKLSGSYFLTSTANINSTETNRNYIVGDPVNGTINYLETNPSNTDNLSHRANLRLNWKLDSTNSLLIKPKISFQQNTSENPLAANTINGLNETISRLSNFTNTQTDGYRASSSILYRHSFKKKGRTFSTEINPGINGQAGNTKLANSNYFISDTTSRDQKTDLLKNTTTFSGNITLTESLDSNNFVAATVSTNINQNNNDRLAYLMDAATLGYTRLDTFFSSKFINGYSQHKFGVSYRYQTYKWNITTSLGGQLALLDGQQSMPKNSDLSRQFTSLLPSFQARYNLGMKRNLRMNYNTSNNAPSIDQLQPVVNNNNTMQLSSGNPMLVQDYQHSLFLRYFSVTPESGKNVFWMINSQYSNNYISNKTILGGRETKWILMDSNVFSGPQSSSESYSGSDSVLLSPGGQITIPVNVNGYYSLRFFGSWGKTIKKINVNTNAGITTSHIPSLIQMGNSKAVLNYATNPSVTAGLVLASNISEKIDFTVSGNGAYSQVVNSIQKSNNQTYINYNGRFAMNFMPTKKWVINSDVTYQAYQGLSSSFNQKYYLWNAGLGYKFMKGNAGELRLTAYDILNQNRSIQRNVTQTYYEDVRTKVLTRYLMITFTYKLRKFNGKGEDGKNMKMFFPGGMPPPGTRGHGTPGR
ncbi:MAG: outer membrane beta-barrel protein [Bacteroidetes bacterium]|nr:outer membrane beta-barrel protein [Bacteroidota bacterium]